MSITLLDILTILLAVLAVLVIIYYCTLNLNSKADNDAYLDDVSVDLGENYGAELNTIDIKENIFLYEIQPLASVIEFKIGSSIGEITGVFQNFSGCFTMLKSGENNKPASISVNMDSLAIDKQFIYSMLTSAEFFDVENFPSISFAGSSFEWVSEKYAILIGGLTIKNVTRKVAFYVELIGSKDDFSDGESPERITLKATANIRRSEFDLNAMSSIVNDNVSLNISIDASKTNIKENREEIKVSSLH